MTTLNHSSVSEFILGGLTKCPELQLPLFLLFLGIYVVTVVGDLGMILLISISDMRSVVQTLESGCLGVTPSGAGNLIALGLIILNCEMNSNNTYRVGLFQGL